MRPKLSVREAARRAGISEGWWRQVVRGYQPLKGGAKAPMRGSADTVAHMADVVGVTPEELEQAGRPDAAEELRLLRPERGGVMDRVEAQLDENERLVRMMREARELNEQNQRVVEDLIRSLRRSQYSDNGGNSAS